MKIPQQTIAATLAMTFSVFAQRAAAFTATRSSAFVPNKMTTRAASTFGRSLAMYAEKGQAEVILVGCGAPNRGMGWYHAVQMLEKDCPSASLDYVVEPWFMGAGGEGPGGEEFKEWQAESEAKHGVKFATSLADLPPPEAPRLALISGRTADNPKLLSESIANGCKCIYLEKPGAPTVGELEAMATEAKEAGVEVLMGYNKNVCKYVRKTMEFAETLPGSHVTFVSNNAYENTPESLGECFERNAEGMLKNMAIHELALLVSFYDVSVDNIESVTADKEFSSMQTLASPESGKEYTDFDKIKFTITTKTGKQVSVAADRCGGTDSYATVSDKDGKEVFRYYMPDEDDRVMVNELTEKYPTAMPYFFTQHPDYITVKERVAKHTVDGEPAEGVATIDIAVDTLKVAEYLTPLLQEQLK
mmetsp:Transcript_5410/g.7102  ORF Transcript_5410/g.7102 Transcript_5410/m.7102 type:complete len:418 (+) Transcript_5410:151-1404(+)